MAKQQKESCLAEHGRRLWKATIDSRQLSEPQMEMLLLACKQFDRAAEARVILQNEKIVSMDRFGQEKQHPAVQIERQASLACTNILIGILGKAPELEPANEEEDFFDK